MTSANEVLLKHSDLLCSNMKDNLDGFVEMMKEYAEGAIKDHLIKAAERAQINSNIQISKYSIINTPIILI